MRELLVLLGLLACGEDATDGGGSSVADGPMDVGEDTSDANSNNATPGELRFGHDYLCEAPPAGEEVLCTRDSECAPGLGCQPSRNRCTKECVSSCEDSREGRCLRVVPLVCAYGEPSTPIEELLTEGRQCGSSDDCPPKYLNTPLLGCGQLDI